MLCNMSAGPPEPGAAWLPASELGWAAFRILLQMWYDLKKKNNKKTPKTLIGEKDKCFK